MEEDFAVDNTTKLKAYTWCQEYLGGVWTQIDLEDFHIRDLRWVLCAHCTSSMCGHGARGDAGGNHVGCCSAAARAV